MNQLERFHAVMNFQPVDRLPRIEWAAWWGQTIDRWKAEGLPDKGSALAGTELTEAEFKDVLRTGGHGELGNEHLYGTSAISESGIGALYVYLQSLAE